MSGSSFRNIPCQSCLLVVNCLQSEILMNWFFRSLWLMHTLQVSGIGILGWLKAFWLTHFRSLETCPSRPCLYRDPWTKLEMRWLILLVRNRRNRYEKYLNRYLNKYTNRYFYYNLNINIYKWSTCINFFFHCSIWLFFYLRLHTKIRVQFNLEIMMSEFIAFL